MNFFKLNKNQVTQIAQVAEAAGQPLAPSGCGWESGHAEILAYCEGALRDAPSKGASLLRRIVEAGHEEIDAERLSPTPEWVVSRARASERLAPYRRISVEEEGGRKFFRLLLGGEETRVFFNKKTNLRESLEEILVASEEYDRQQEEILASVDDAPHWRRDENGAYVASISEATGLHPEVVRVRYPVPSSALACLREAGRVLGSFGWEMQIPPTDQAFNPSDHADRVVLTRNGISYVTPEGVAIGGTSDPTARASKGAVEPMTATVEAYWTRPA
jgi:hypothetical protein